MLFPFFSLIDLVTSSFSSNMKMRTIFVSFCEIIPLSMVFWVFGLFVCDVRSERENEKVREWLYREMQKVAEGKEELRKTGYVYESLKEKQYRTGSG